jgi:hypothetical protein
MSLMTRVFAAFFIGMHGTGVLFMLSDLFRWRSDPYVLLKQSIWLMFVPFPSSRCCRSSLCFVNCLVKGNLSVAWYLKGKTKQPDAEAYAD